MLGCWVVGPLARWPVGPFRRGDLRAVGLLGRWSVLVGNAKQQQKRSKVRHSTAQQCIATKSESKRSNAICKSKSKKHTTKQRGAKQKAQQTEAKLSKAMTSKSQANAFRRRKATGKAKRSEARNSKIRIRSSKRTATTKRTWAAGCPNKRQHTSGNVNP